ncbi:hypothetical protein [Sorangium sp. So ce1153]|uniref:hypothetical protein n=1 Tax=Sorangium sp. So ce1153 TaxID=3133333 RepID=UPI003F61B51C
MPGSAAFLLYRYSRACSNLRNGSSSTVMARSHFTLAILYQPGTMGERDEAWSYPPAAGTAPDWQITFL